MQASGKHPGEQGMNSPHAIQPHVWLGALCLKLKLGLENGTKNNGVHPRISILKFEYFKIFIIFLEMIPEVKA